MWVAELRLVDERYALRLEQLSAVVSLRAVTPMPLAPNYVVGLLRFESHPITVLSLAVLLGIRGWQRDPTVLLVLELEGGRHCAVDAEVIPRPLGLPVASVDAARSRAPGAAMTEVILPDGGLVRLLDMAALLKRVTGGS
jgi:chemotaxis signal transduction protein